MSRKMNKKISSLDGESRVIAQKAIDGEIRKTRTQKAKKILNLSVSELSAKSAEIESLLFKSRMQNSVGQLANTASLWNLRKQLARVKTQLSRLQKLELLKQSKGA